MNKIRKFAIWAHQELIERIHCRTKDLECSFSADTEVFAQQYFIRICTLRYMEVNGYLPGQMRIFSLKNQKYQPQLLFEHPEHLQAFDSLDIEEFNALKEKGHNADLARYIFIVLCKGLSLQLPGVFSPLDENSKRLIPDDLFNTGGIIDRLVNDIQEDAFDAIHGIGVEVIGWLYQYYISERREEIIDPLYRKNITSAEIPTATQVFTPDWIVQYIVDNSLGRYWMEQHPDSHLTSKLKYFINCQNHKKIPNRIKGKSNKSTFPVGFRVLDPCVGAGHFLVYAIDVLIHIYRECGYSDADAISEIISHNIYGLDIDSSVVQIARFAILMKGCQYDKSFLSRGIKPQIYQIQSLSVPSESKIEEYYGDNNDLKDSFRSVCNQIHNAGNVGSILQLSQVSSNDLSAFESFYKSVKPVRDEDFSQMINIIRMMTSKYDIVITNPPYLNKYDDELKDYLLNHYKNYSGDLFSVFIYRCLQFCKPGGYAGLMTPNVWMFIKSYEKLRRYILGEHSITTLVQLAKGSFFNDATVDVCAFVIQSQSRGKSGTYFRLEDFSGRMHIQKQKLTEAIENPDCSYRYRASSDLFQSLPGAQIGYWMGKHIIQSFKHGKSFGKIASPRQGLATTDNHKYLRHWYEIDFHHIGFGLDRETAIHSNIKWFPYNKGGEFRKWYGNQDYVVNYQYDGKAIKNDVLTKYPYLKTPDYVVKNPDTYFSPSLSWSKISSGKAAFRYFPQGFLYDVSGCSIFFKNESDLYVYAGFLNSIVCKQILEILSPTLNYEAGHISALPVLDFTNYHKRIQALVQNNIALSHEDWDLFETSWGFKRHPLIKTIKNESLIADQFKTWETECIHRFKRLKSNEEELNRIFIDIYGLQNELSPEVRDKDVTVYKADLVRDIKSLISYAVGCMFGRYTLDKEGLCFAGGHDNTHIIIPIMDDDFFADNIMTRFTEFIRDAYGSSTLEENLRFIANALGGNGKPLDDIRSYFINDFYTDHVKTYQKRPIYWLFSSGKQNAFNCLIYIHRYQHDTISRIRTEYIHKLQTRCQNDISKLESHLKSTTGCESAVLKIQLKKLKDQMNELNKYEEKLHHLEKQNISIDLDDGVKVNYAMFGDVVQAIK